MTGTPEPPPPVAPPPLPPPPPPPPPQPGEATPGGRGAWRPLVIVALVLAILVVGSLALTAGDDDEATVAARSSTTGRQTTTTPPRPTTTTTDRAPTTTSTSPPPGGVSGGGPGTDGDPIATDMEDGEHFVFIRFVDAPARIVTFDLSQFLTGDEAQQAAEEDGAVAPGEPVPNDYYIRNQNAKLRDLPVRASLKLRIVDWADCCDLIPGEFGPFAAAFDLDADTSGQYHGPDSPYLITVKNGFITEIEEVFLP